MSGKVLPLDYESDIQVIRRLMHDSFHTTRTYAVLALKRLGRIEAADREALEAVLCLDDGAARAYAQELLATKL
jgi:16S rRNA U516 pseudouridylate synthase RsuA-like enzyme